MKLQNALQVRVLLLWISVDFLFWKVTNFVELPQTEHFWEKTLVDIKTGKQVSLSGLCLLEIKTHSEGNLEPLSSVTGVHAAQIQLQEECAEANVCILQSCVPESKKSKYFLIRKNNNFINALKLCCNAILRKNKIDITSQDNILAQKLQGLSNQVPSFENLLPLRQ